MFSVRVHSLNLECPKYCQLVTKQIQKRGNDTDRESFATSSPGYEGIEVDCSLTCQLVESLDGNEQLVWSATSKPWRNKHQFVSVQTQTLEKENEEKSQGVNENKDDDSESETEILRFASNRYWFNQKVNPQLSSSSLTDDENAEEGKSKSNECLLCDEDLTRLCRSKIKFEISSDSKDGCNNVFAEGYLPLLDICRGKAIHIEDLVMKIVDENIGVTKCSLFCSVVGETRFLEYILGGHIISIDKMIAFQSAFPQEWIEKYLHEEASLSTHEDAQAFSKMISEKVEAFKGTLKFGNSKECLRLRIDDLRLRYEFEIKNELVENLHALKAAEQETKDETKEVEAQLESSIIQGSFYVEMGESKTVFIHKTVGRNLTEDKNWTFSSFSFDTLENESLGDKQSNSETSIVLSELRKLSDPGTSNVEVSFSESTDNGLRISIGINPSLERSLVDTSCIIDGCANTCENVLANKHVNIEEEKSAHEEKQIDYKASSYDRSNSIIFLPAKEKIRLNIIEKLNSEHSVDSKEIDVERLKAKSCVLVDVLSSISESKAKDSTETVSAAIESERVRASRLAKESELMNKHERAETFWRESDNGFGYAEYLMRRGAFKDALAVIDYYRNENEDIGITAKSQATGSYDRLAAMCQLELGKDEEALQILTAAEQSCDGDLKRFILRLNDLDSIDQGKKPIGSNSNFDVTSSECLKIAQEALSRSLIRVGELALIGANELEQSPCFDEEYVQNAILRSRLSYLQGKPRASIEILELLNRDAANVNWDGISRFLRTERLIALGTAHLKLGNNDDARMVFSEAVAELNDTDKSDAHQSQSQTQQAIEQKFAATIFYNMGKLGLSFENYRAARMVFKQATENRVTSKKAWAWLYLGISALYAGELDEAENALMHANILDNNNPLVWLYMATVSSKLENRIEAEYALQKALDCGIALRDFSEMSEIRAFEECYDQVTKVVQNPDINKTCMQAERRLQYYYS